MMNAIDLPDAIPLFPLPGALLLPRGTLPLHIFEPRYLQMIEDCLKTPGRLIGMILPRNHGEDEAELAPIGCAGRLTGFSETEDGRYLITLTGISRFRLMGARDGFTPYIMGEVEWDEFSGDLHGPDHDRGLQRESFFALLSRFFEANGMDTDWDSLRDAEDELLINSLSMLMPLSPEDKQALLEAPNLTVRRETLLTLMDFSLRSGGEGEESLQ
ncbi:LON peptidase substrate-binding domain-containing protein [Thioclava sp. GXIMD4216]|uniref:LON peptidase substrate-binding domain-containing protein n=1 Tax=Thioclava litoralis TaxID=3076557 RepID=A0ABZ1E0V7_9RHOB|nr:LON peptidase substrate-binding domain-containing protein [Thioclava sp. FTW29]